MYDKPHELTPLEREAYDAMHQFAQKALVYLVESPLAASLDNAPNSSGTLVCTPGGRVVVLTARHVLTDKVPGVGVTVGGSGDSNGVPNALGREWLHPDPEIDVALVELAPAAAARLGARAFAANIVAPSDDANVGADQATVINGYPFAYRRKAVDHRAKIVAVVFTSISYLTIVAPERDRQGRYRVTWGRALLAEPDELIQPGVRPGDQFHVGEPHGISGGPLWRFMKVPKTEVWELSKMARIIGVASTFIREDGLETCPSVVVWGDWFRATIAAIDKVGVHSG